MNRSGRPRVLHLDAGPGFRGGQRQVALLIEGLARAGYACAVLAASATLRERATRAGVVSRDWRPRGDLDPGAAVAVARAVRAFRPDLIHAHDARSHVAGWFAARLAGSARLVVSRRTDAPIGRGAASRLKYRLPVARWLAVSRAVARELERAGVPSGRIAVVPSGVTVAPAAEDEARARLGLAPGEVAIGTVAALTPEKGHRVALEAAAIVHAARPDVRFVWLGDGPLRAELEAARDALSLGSVVRLAGEVPDASRWMPAFAVLAAPSLVEGLGTAAIEALAAGVPVVASDAGGLPEALGDCDACRIVRACDPAALAAALLERLAAADRPGGRAALAASARARAAAFSVEAMVAETRREYDRALGRSLEAGAAGAAADSAGAPR